MRAMCVVIEGMSSVYFVNVANCPNAKCNGSVFLSLQIASSQLLVCNSVVKERDKQKNEIKQADLWKETNIEFFGFIL